MADAPSTAQAETVERLCKLSSVTSPPRSCCACAAGRWSRLRRSAASGSSPLSTARSATGSGSPVRLRAPSGSRRQTRA